MKIEILGPSCSNCEKLQKLTEEVVKETGVPATVEKVSDMQKIMGYGVMRTPAIAIFVVTYALIIWDKFDRSLVALSGAAIMILFKILSQDNAFEEIDFNTIGLLIGMMIIVMVTKRSGGFEYLAVKMVKVAKAEPFKIIILLSIVTGILSAFLDNVTTIMLIIPVTLSVARDLKISPIPFIISEVFASNVGGTATLVGDPPNILIGSAVGLSLMDFLENNAPIIFPYYAQSPSNQVF